MPRKRIAVRGKPVEISDAQYRALRYWADNSVDQGFDYVRRHPVPPQIISRTIDVLVGHGLWFWTPSGFVVLDAGRRAVGLAPADRDEPCPTCGAGRGERCHLLARRAGGALHVVGARQWTVHPERTGKPAPLLRGDARAVVGAAGPVGAQVAAQLNDPHDVHHVGYGTAT